MATRAQKGKWPVTTAVGWVFTILVDCYLISSCEFVSYSLTRCRSGIGDLTEEIADKGLTLPKPSAIRYEGEKWGLTRLIWVAVGLIRKPFGRREKLPNPT